MFLFICHRATQQFSFSDRAFDLGLQWAVQNACDDVKLWMKRIEDRSPPPSHGGHVRVALTLALVALLEEKPFVEAMRATLAFGGDTDTKYSIVNQFVRESRYIASNDRMRLSLSNDRMRRSLVVRLLVDCWARATATTRCPSR